RVHARDTRPMSEIESNEKRKTAEEWGRKNKQWKEGNPYVPQAPSHWAWKHAVADKLHGWAEHAYHYADDPLLMTEADYLAALEAAANYPNTSPHAAALSKLKQRD